MKKKPLTKEVVKKLIFVGIACLLLGMGLAVYAPSFSKNNLQIARNATNVKEAAQEISSNNQKEILFHMIGMAGMGAGVAFVGFGIMSLSKIKKE